LIAAMIEQVAWRLCELDEVTRRQADFASHRHGRAS